MNHFMILDCETATLPKASEYGNEEKKKRVAIAKPLIYDLGWTIIDENGEVVKKVNFLIAEIFSVPSIFDTAYFKEKRTIYLEKLQKGEIMLTPWSMASIELEKDLKAVACVGASNSMFDFKKAIPFTELYISKLYAPDFHEWLNEQHRICDWIAEGGKMRNEKAHDFEKNIFRYRGGEYDLFDVWGLACKHLINCDEYKMMCLQNQWKTKSGKYFITNAEKVFAFLSQDLEFSESHTAIDDCIIEGVIFAEIHKRTCGNWEKGIIYFPFKELGTVAEFCQQMGIENPFVDN